MSQSLRRRVPTLAQLLARYGVRADGADVSTVSLSACLTSGHDPHSILRYLAGLVGSQVSTLDDLMVIADMDDEEELGAFRVQEGVAVSIASHGAWVVFSP